MLLVIEWVSETHIKCATNTHISDISYVYLSTTKMSRLGKRQKSMFFVLFMFHKTWEVWKMFEIVCSHVHKKSTILMCVVRVWISSAAKTKRLFFLIQQTCSLLFLYLIAKSNVFLELSMNCIVMLKSKVFENILKSWDFCCC
jgi:hypothetical protein